MSIQKEFDRISKIVRRDWGVFSNVYCSQHFSWMIYLKFLDFYSSPENPGSFAKDDPNELKEPYRWSNWAVSKKRSNGSSIQKVRSGDKLKDFINKELFPYLCNYKPVRRKKGNATPMSPYDNLSKLMQPLGNRVQSCEILRESLDLIDMIDFNSKSNLKEFSKGYENLIEFIMFRDNYAGEHFTQRPLIRAIVDVIKPKAGERIYDAASGTCGFLTSSFDYIMSNENQLTPEQLDTLRQDTLFGRDESLYACLLGATNMILRGIQTPNLVNENILHKRVRKTLGRDEFDIVFASMPINRTISWNLQQNFPVRHGSSVLLYLQHVMMSVKAGGRAAIVVPEFLLRHVVSEFKQVRRNLLEDFDVHTILNLPSGIFHPNSFIEPSVLFFDRTSATNSVWHYNFGAEMDWHAAKNLTDKDFQEFARLQSTRETTTCSWTVRVNENSDDFDLAPINPEDTRRKVPEEQAIQNELEHNNLKLVTETLTEVRKLFTGLLDKWFGKVRTHQVIDEIAKIKGGKKLPNGRKASDKSSEFQYLSVSAFTESGRIDQSQVKYVTKSVYEKIRENAVTDSNLYVNIAGKAGISGIVPVEFNGALLSEDTVILTIKDRNKLDLKYLYLFTLTSDFKSQIEDFTSFVDNSSVSLSLLKLIAVPICSIEEQYELVNTVWSVKEEINELEDMVGNQSLEGANYLDESLIRLQNLKSEIKQLTMRGEQKNTPGVYTNGNASFDMQVLSCLTVQLLTQESKPITTTGPVTKIMLPENGNGRSRDWLTITEENPVTLVQRKVMAFVRKTFRTINGNSVVWEAVQEAWRVFNDPAIFAQDRDAISLISEPNGTREFDQFKCLGKKANRSESTIEFGQLLENPKLVPEINGKFLRDLRGKLREENGGKEISSETLHGFLRCFQFQELDFREDSSGLPQVLKQILAPFGQESKRLWDRALECAMSFTQNAGAITKKSLPADLMREFPEKSFETIPDVFRIPDTVSNGFPANHKESPKLALLALIGSFYENSFQDRNAVEQILELKLEDWRSKVGDLSILPNPPLVESGGFWKVDRKLELLNRIGGRLTDTELNAFMDVAKMVLGQTNPSFELPNEKRDFASILKKNPIYSSNLCEGVSEGLALIGNHPGLFTKCSSELVRNIPSQVVRKLLSNANWQQWCTVSRQLPNLAEAAPDEFLKQLRKALKMEPCPIRDMFYQNGDDFHGGNFETGLLQALEVLAWDEEYLKESCMILGKLATLTGERVGQNLQFNSIERILLPWMPQTLAPWEKRLDAVKALLKKNNELGWNLLLRFLPNLVTSSIGTCKPRWRIPNKSDFNVKMTAEKYREQVECFADLAIKQVGSDIGRLQVLLSYIDHLPISAFGSIVKKLGSAAFNDETDQMKKKVWEKLHRFIIFCESNSDAGMSLSRDNLAKLKKVAKKFDPKDVFFRCQHLFSDYEEKLVANGSIANQSDSRDEKRTAAVSELLRKRGLGGVLKLAGEVETPRLVGMALAKLGHAKSDRKLIPQLLMDSDGKLLEFVRAYIGFQHNAKGWIWADGILNKSWTNAQTANFLACMPFEKDTWDRVELHLQDHESEYWKIVAPCLTRHEASEFAIEKLLQFRHIETAITCMTNNLSRNAKINSNLAVRALLANLNSGNPAHSVLERSILELIRCLQQDPDTDAEKLISVEWAYLPLLNGNTLVRPTALEFKLATDPKFFCEVIQSAYGPAGQGQTLQEPDNARQLAAIEALLQLLQDWRIPPGMEKNGTFNPDKFEDWLQVVKRSLKSVLLTVALNIVGNVLVHAPGDSDGLWINRTIANALNGRDIADMRGGFRHGMLNRQNSGLDSTNGSFQSRLTDEFLEKAETVEREGFKRLASTLREVASIHDHRREMNGSRKNAQSLRM